MDRSSRDHAGRCSAEEPYGRPREAEGRRFLFASQNGSAPGVASQGSSGRKVLMKVKVFHVITKLELGGAQKVTLMMLERLPRDRYELGLVTGPEGILVDWANRIPSLNRFWIPTLVREVNPIRDFLTLLNMWRVFKRERPQIVHTHCAKAGILGRLAARLAGVPIIFHTYHGFGFNDFQKRIVRTFYIWLERLTGRVTTKTIAVS